MWQCTYIKLIFSRTLRIFVIPYTDFDGLCAKLLRQLIL
jgi:hypothetical protein